MIAGQTVQLIGEKRMRRNDREIKDRKDIDGIIRRCLVCHLATCDNGQPYVVPLNFGYDGRFLYFHAAPEGRKIDIINKNNRVGFEFDILHEIVTAQQACDWGGKIRERHWIRYGGNSR